MLRKIQQKHPNFSLFFAGMFLGISLISINTSFAAFITTPPITAESNQQVGALSISTSTAATTLQINASSTFAAFFLNQSTSTNAGAVFDIRSGDLTRFFITRDGLVGIATNTPAQTLSVQGNGLFSGNLSVAGLTATGTTQVASTTNLGPLLTGNLTATGTVTLGAAKLVIPATDGTDGQFLQTNGSGVLSFAAGGTWSLLASSTLTAASSTCSLQFTGGQSELEWKFFATGRSAAVTETYIRFNGDAGANYGRFSSSDWAAGGAGNAETAFDNTYTSAQPIFFNMKIANPLATRKLGFITKIIASATAANGPLFQEAGVVYNNTTSHIYNIQIIANGAETWNAGSKCSVYGSVN